MILPAAAAARFLAFLAIAAAQIPAPAAIPRNHGGVIATNAKGDARWSADWTMEPWSVNGQKAVRFSETGRGIYSPFMQEVQWTLESIWLAEGNYFPLRFEKTFRTPQGRVLAVETKIFDKAAGKVTYEWRNEKGMRESSAFDARADILTIEGIAGILQNFPFAAPGSSRKLDAHLLTNEPRLYDISIEPRGTEKLKTARGEVDCYKLEVVPHLGLMNLFRAFAPKTYFWFSVAPPHSWMRFQGLENGLGSAEIVMTPK